MNSEGFHIPPYILRQPLKFLILCRFYFPALRGRETKPYNDKLFN